MIRPVDTEFVCKPFCGGIYHIDFQFLILSAPTQLFAQAVNGNDALRVQGVFVSLVSIHWGISWQTLTNMTCLRPLRIRIIRRSSIQNGIACLLGGVVMKHKHCCYVAVSV